MDWSGINGRSFKRLLTAWMRHVLILQEKWDSMTRKWRDNRSLVESVKLFLIDEVRNF